MIKKRRGDIWISGWKSICEKILKRDNFRCLDCSIKNTAHQKKYNRRLTIDHVDGDLNNNEDYNLRTLGLSCHARKDGIRTHRLILQDKKEEVIYKYSKNRSLQSISREYGISYEVVRRSLIRWGIRIRGHKEAQTIIMSNPAVRENVSKKLKFLTMTKEGTI